MNLFKTKFSAKTGWRVSETITEGTSISIGERSTLRAATERFGYQYGAVSTAWGCFHSYSYEMSDPSNLVPGTDGYEMVLTVPVDGGTSVWSTPRYNALAEALGDLPVIEIPYTIGEVSSYPESPERLSGQKLQNSELLFSELRDYEVSDVATVSWSYSRGETTTNSQNVNWDIGASANVTVGSVSVGASVSQGWGQGYRLTVGQTALFFGSIPPLYDDLSTQNDEYIENSYRVTPVVYVETYTDASGSEAAYFVYTYAAD